MGIIIIRHSVSAYILKTYTKHHWRFEGGGGKGTIIGNTRVSVAYYSFYDNIQLYDVHYV